jgi:serine/threonine-protein kinase
VSDAQRTLAQGRYRLESVLGEGGMATVYAAWDDRLKVHRAVKVLSPVYARRPDLRMRFQKEAIAMARVRHPHVLSVYDVSTDDPPFLVMDLEEGGSLAAHVAAFGPMPARQAVEVGLQMLDGLHAAYLAGIVHRDVKPHNVLLTRDGVAKVSDFGIAQLADRTAYTRTGAVMGTLEFMAPEQSEDASDVDVRADVYSAGATLYVLLTDRKPRDLYVRELEDRVWAEVPALLRAPLQRATKHDRDQRFRDPAAFARALQGVLPQLPPVPAAAARLGSAGAGLHVNAVGRDLSDPVALTTPLPDATVEPPHSERSTVPPEEEYRRKTRFRGILVAASALAATALVLVAAAVAWTQQTPPDTDAARMVPPTLPSPAPSPLPVPAAAPVAADPPVVEPHPAPRPRSPVVPAPKPPPEPEPTPAPAAAAVVPTGTLFVNSVPPGTARVDGVDRGPVPLSLTLPAGPHEVTVLHGDWAPLTRTVDVREAERTPLCWDFAADGPCPRR